MPRRKQGLRSYHNKSRNGCSNCKRRRVKCNMQDPVCGNCVRRNERCEYPCFSGTSSALWTMELPTLRNTSLVATSPSSSDAVPRTFFSPEFGTWGPRHEYAGPTSGTIETTLTFPSQLKHVVEIVLGNSWFSGLEQSLWAPALEDSATRYPYVQHSIFSLVALIDELDGPYQGRPRLLRRTPVTAYQHHINASSLFRQTPPVVDAQNWVAVMTFGISMIIFHFAVQQLYTDNDFNAIETFRILRTSMALNNESLPHLTRSRMWPLIMARMNVPNLSIDVELRVALQKLSWVVSEAMEHDLVAAEPNRHAFWELREWAFDCQGKPRIWRHYLGWPAAVVEGYLALISNGHDIALLIFIHWCAIMYQSPRRWFIVQWAKRTAFMARDMLQGNWQDILSWPLEALERGITLLPQDMLAHGFITDPDPVPSQPLAF